MPGLAIGVMLVRVLLMIAKSVDGVMVYAPDQLLGTIVRVQIGVLAGRGAEWVYVNDVELLHWIEVAAGDVMVMVMVVLAARAMLGIAMAVSNVSLRIKKAPLLRE